MHRSRLVAATAPALVTLALLAAAVTPREASAKSHILREGDVVKVRLVRSLDAGDIHTGDTIAVMIPEAWQRDPKGSPDIEAGTRGLITLKEGEKKPKEVHFELTHFDFYPGGRKVSAAARLGQDTPGVIPLHGASAFKKMFLPPLLGIFLWHGGGSLEAGSTINVEIAKRVDW